MVLEFCSVGNLLDYLRRGSDCFIDQKDQTSDSFTWKNYDAGTTFESKGLGLIRKDYFIYGANRRFYYQQRFSAMVVSSC